MSPSGLLSFLRSETRRPPQARTYQKLIAWFVRIRRHTAVGPSADTVEAGVAILVQYLPADKRGAAVREILNVIDVHAEGERPPPWLRELRVRYPDRSRKKTPR